MKIKWIVIILLFLISIISEAQEAFQFWIGFTDKNTSPYSMDNPREFLSERAISRRIKQNISYSVNDIPVNQNYIDSIKFYYPNIRYASKWFNGVVVESSDSIIHPEINKYKFVREIRLVYSNSHKKSVSVKFQDNFSLEKDQGYNSRYGYTYLYLKNVNGLFLHYSGFKGDSIIIVILDAGFERADILPVFHSLRINNKILSTADFVSQTSSVYNENAHGMNVFSLVGGNIPGTFIGSAPEASFCLVRTEDVNSEYIVEEYNWARGAEYADSIGADIINSSLGYFQFDDTTQDYRYENLDGNTAISTRAADIAASKGILVVSSAGNEGTDSWHYINAPADGDSVLSVGATNYKNIRAKFSSYGPRIDGVIKPNIMAPGDSIIIQNSDNSFVYGSGTSFSAPIITGFAACLWQAFPNASNMDIFNAIQMSSTHYINPNDSLGYGTPDFEEAFAILYQKKLDQNNAIKNFDIFPNPFSSSLYILIKNNISTEIRVDIFTIQGKLIFSQKFDPVYLISPYLSINGFENDPKGLYLVRVSTNSIYQTFKVIKIE